MQYIYEHTIPGSPLRRFSIDIMARVWRGGNPQPLGGLDFTGEIWQDLAKALVTRPMLLAKCGLGRLTMCKWHVHADGESCATGWSEQWSTEAGAEARN